LSLYPEAVKRNRERFPGDFLFQLDKQEVERLRSQIVTSSQGGRRYAPYAFTEQGVAMLSSVLRSPRAVRVNIEIMRAFVRLRAILSANKEFSRKLDELEKQLATHDKAIAALFTAIRELASPPPSTPKRRFLPDE
jgi:hypothetical protein